MRARLYSAEANRWEQRFGVLRDGGPRIDGEEGRGGEKEWDVELAARTADAYDKSHPRPLVDVEVLVSVESGGVVAPGRGVRPLALELRPGMEEVGDRFSEGLGGKVGGMRMERESKSPMTSLLSVGGGGAHGWGGREEGEVTPMGKERERKRLGESRSVAGLSQPLGGAGGQSTRLLDKLGKRNRMANNRVAGAKQVSGW